MYCCDGLAQADCLKNVEDSGTLDQKTRSRASRAILVGAEETMLRFNKGAKGNVNCEGPIQRFQRG